MWQKLIILFHREGGIIDVILENILMNKIERERETSISRDSILRARAITRLSSFGKMNPLSLSFYFQSRLHMDRHTRAYIRVSIVKWTCTWFIFLWKISRDRHLLFLFPRRVEKNATPRRISMMNICVVRLLGLPRIKVGLIGWSIHTMY